MAALPKIPGMTCGEELLRTNFRKTQLLSRPDRNTTRPDWNADTFRMTSNNAAAGTTKAISLDRKVLRFSCFWREGVHESAAEAQRVRKCIIYYFLEDDTIAVTEPKQDNSGIPGQGAFIKRHQIPRPDGKPYTFEDFNIGAEVTFYGKTFHVVDCDPFTRNFFEKLGVEVPEPEYMPFDSYSDKRRRHAAANTARRGKQEGEGDFLGTTQRTTITGGEIAKTKKFLAYDKQVLRFYCMYDDRASLYGDVHLFTLHYFLADDTIEITETNPPNCGRDPFPSFVKRSKIPKVPEGEPYRNPNSNMLFKKEQVEYFTHADLRIGKKMSFYGRLMLIFDIDEFTRNFLRETYGITDFTPISVAQPGPSRIPVEVPPHNGFGDEEDSLGSWKNLAVKPMKRDTKRLMENSTKQLKFQLQFAQADSANAIRKFVLTFFLADGTLSIFEPAQRNSGIVGGKFLNRQKVKKIGPDGKPSNVDLSADDIYVGGEVAINQHKFRVIGTDERSLELMESDPELFPLSNVPAILTKIRRHAAGILQSAFAGVAENKMDYRQFATILEGLELPLVEQEIMSVLRYFDGGDGNVDFRRFVDIVVGRN